MKKVILTSLILVLSFGFSAVYASDSNEIVDTTEIKIASNPYNIVSKELTNDVVCTEKEKLLGHVDDYEYWVLSGKETFEHRCDQGFSSCKVILRNNKWFLVARASSKGCGSSCGGAITKCYAMGKLKPQPQP